jgi:hypothetical protein
MEHHFDSRLPEGILHDLKQCLNIYFTSIQFENSSFFINELGHTSIGCSGHLCLTFSTVDGIQIYVDLYSKFDELPVPMIDHGAISISKPTTARDRLKEPFAPSPYKSILRHEAFSPLVKILFYGNQQSAYLNELNEICTLENLKEWYGIDEMPFMQYESIEFIVLVHNNGKATRIRTQQGGFDIKILEMSELLQDPAKDNYVIVNGYEKNIVLQHQVG